MSRLWRWLLCHQFFLELSRICESFRVRTFRHSANSAIARTAETNANAETPSRAPSVVFSFPMVMSRMTTPPIASIESKKALNRMRPFFDNTGISGPNFALAILRATRLSNRSNGAITKTTANIIRIPTRQPSGTGSRISSSRCIYLQSSIGSSLLAHQS